MRQLVALASFLLLAQTVASQSLTFTPRPDAEDGLPASIRVFDVTRDGTSQRATLIRADLAVDDWELEAVLSDEGGETVASFAEDDGVYAAINGGYFGAGQSFSLVLNDGELVSPNIKQLNRDGTAFFPTRGAVGITDARQPDVAWVYDIDGTTYAYPTPNDNAPGAPAPEPTATFPAGGGPWDVTTAIGGGPVLVEAGAVNITFDEEVMFGSGVDLTTPRARTAVGYTADRKLLLLAVTESNGLRLSELAQLMVDLGSVEAINLDGGGSTAMTSGGADLIASSRPVISALRLRDPNASEPEEQEILFDTGDDSYSEVGDWFESANVPFAGGTPSRLNKTGTGEDRAVFTFEGIVGGTYNVSAWWTPSSNRATNTPFIVYQKGTPTTVRANQTFPTSVGVWNNLGDFELAEGDSLVVTDDATGTGADVFVVADAIRLVGPLGGTTVEPEAPVTSTLRVGPNPAFRQLGVSLTVAAPGPVRIELVDALGRRVRDETVEASSTAQVRLNVANLRPGLYIVRATSAAGSESRAVTILR